MATNSILGFSNNSLVDLQESIGITQFPSEDEWNQIIGGLIIQGGKTPDIPLDTELVINFSIPFTKKVLGIWPAEIYGGTLIGAFGGVFIKPDYSLSSFTLRNDNVVKKYFWFAIGI